MIAPSVFISYARADEAVAQRICEELEHRAISCWIAPRNVPAGMDYGQAIMDGIKNCRVMLVLLSEDSGQSRYVAREVERAVTHNAALLPVRLSDIEIPVRLEFFLGSCQWFDLFNPQENRELSALGNAVARLLVPGNDPEPAPAKPALRPRAAKGRRKVITIAAVSALILASGLVWRFFPNAALLGSQAHARVTLTGPANGASCLGGTQLEWSEDGLQESLLDGFEVEITQPGKPPVVNRTGIRYSYRPQQISGEMAWRVRALFNDGKNGKWSEKRRMTRDQDALGRILRTHELHLGHAESGNNFINGESANLSGFDVDLAKELVTRILRRRDPSATLKLVPHASRWTRSGPDGKPVYFLGLLQRDESVDMLASGISITPEREREGLAFTAPVLVYPQTLITQKNAPGFVDGKPAFQRLGAVDGTTNMALARRLQKSVPDLVVLPFTGSGAHEKMLEALFESREIEACLVDKPLAIRKIKSFQGNDADVEYDSADVREIGGVPVAPESIGFALRPGDKSLREALDREIAGTKDLRGDLVKKYFPMLDPATEVP
jgi:ABC-type amino acid transport substrate-binding protein